MLVKYLLATIVAGLFAGILLTPAMYVRDVPLILHAEEYENAGGHEHSHDTAAAATAESAPAAVAPHAHEEEEAGPALPFGRSGNTLLINLVAGAGFALITGAAALFLGGGSHCRTGFTGVSQASSSSIFAPAFSLAPELPAMPAADLAARQAWWLDHSLFSQQAASISSSFARRSGPRSWALR